MLVYGNKLYQYLQLNQFQSDNVVFYDIFHQQLQDSLLLTNRYFHPHFLQVNFQQAKQSNHFYHFLYFLMHQQKWRMGLYLLYYQRRKELQLHYTLPVHLGTKYVSYLTLSFLKNCFVENQLIFFYHLSNHIRYILQYHEIVQRPHHTFYIL